EPLRDGLHRDWDGTGRRAIMAQVREPSLAQCPMPGTGTFGLGRGGRAARFPLPPMSLVDPGPHMPSDTRTETPGEPVLHTHPGRIAHSHDDPLGASHAHAHAD